MGGASVGVCLKSPVSHCEWVGLSFKSVTPPTRSSLSPSGGRVSIAWSHPPLTRIPAALQSSPWSMADGGVDGVLAGSGVAVTSRVVVVVITLPRGKKISSGQGHCCHPPASGIHSVTVLFFYSGASPCL